MRLIFTVQKGNLMKLTHRATMLACYNGYITQAISINLAPLLYVTFQRSFSLTLTQIGSLIAFNFLTQLLIDFFASFFSERINLRFCAVFAHVMAAMGLIGLSVFPFLLPPYLGLLLAVCCLGVGGGFTEVLISPLIEACPTERKSGNMSFLHSFYSWGQAGVVLVSSIYFYFLTPEQNWYYLPIFWAIVPLLGAVAFCLVPIYRLASEERGEREVIKLFHMPLFWYFLLMMFCAGAAELTMAQWASDFAESALGVSKSVGDLAGPCMFAILMGIARLLYGKYSEKFDLERLMVWCCGLCMLSYLLAAVASVPALSLLGCALCGFSVGIFWPGVLSRAAASIRGGGIAMFALLAVAGDIGCLSGPAIAGAVAEMFDGNLRYAFGFAIIFPLIHLILLLARGMKKRKEEKE